jgi:hypothetical protein
MTSACGSGKKGRKERDIVGGGGRKRWKERIQGKERGKETFDF